MTKKVEKAKKVVSAHDNDVEPKVDAVNLGGAGPAPEATKADKKKNFPEGNATGKFHAVAFEGGFVVYNPAGQRATGVVTDAVAKDLVLKNNQGASIKG